ATAKAIDPAIDVTGVEVEASCAFQTSVRAGRLVPIVPGPTLADGLAGNPDPDTMTFDFVLRLVDDLVAVGEDAIVRAIVGLVEAEHLVVEGAAAVGVGALLAGQVPSAGRRVAAILTGGNID